jgi:hypothetical protein
MSETQIEGKAKVSRILCELLAYGTNDDKPKMKAMFAKIQKQINKSKTNKNKVRLLWYVDAGEKTIEEKRQCLIEESNCVFYVFTPESYKVSDSYLIDIMRGINLFDRSLELMKKEGIKMKKKSEQPEEQPIEEQPLLEPLD